ncbi:MAG: hypothetical protein JRF52_09395 [Deltaproteobacteria bacterium]|nr:hypothetical protein [Deltaproteobacteria bacterium]
MDEPTALDRTFQIIMKQMVETGQADLFSAGVPGWLFPNTDLIASFAPFNNLPTQYRITIDGHQKWFGQ